VKPVDIGDAGDIREIVILTSFNVTAILVGTARDICNRVVVRPMGIQTMFSVGVTADICQDVVVSKFEIDTVAIIV